MSENRNENNEGTRNSQLTQKEPRVNVVIKQHPQLFELLNKPNVMWRVLLSLFLIVVFIFGGIAGVVILIKRYYPYNVIETNLQGATIMKGEDKDVIYWLFNTADLWANSGIEVKAGDVLTIRASGASFTAIHHLVKAAQDNEMPSDRWVGTEGQRKDLSKDRERARFRINNDNNEGILLMKVIPANKQNVRSDWLEKAEDSLLTKDPIEVIGKERQRLVVSQNGMLHFAVNDIVLTDVVLDSMYSQYVRAFLKEIGCECEHEAFLSHFKKIQFEDAEPSQKGVNSKQIDSIIISAKNVCRKYCIDSLGDHKGIEDSLLCGFASDSTFIAKKLDFIRSKDAIIKKLDTFYNKASKVGLEIGPYPVLKNDSTYHKAYPLINELVYYKQKRFRDAWYIDNLGSFLIVIERKR